MPLLSSVTAEKDSPIDLSGSRVYLIGGDFYFSPNSRRDVQVPPAYNEIPFRDCFKDSFLEFRQPLWWQPACPYLAFIPLHPNFAGVPFQDLFHISYFPRLRHAGFMLDPQIILGWARLEKDIHDAVNILLAHECAPPITWIVRTALGCTGSYKRARTLHALYNHSKEWFTLFMGCLSYAVAVSITHRQEHFTEPMPHWFSYLSECNFSQIWLSGIRSSMVTYFDPCIDRAGVFIQLVHHYRGQFSVDWLCEFGIPVWYPWGRREVHASETDACLARFAPLPHQLQETSTFLTTNPSPQHQAQPSIEPQTGPYDCTASSTLIPSWKAFFEKRRARNELLKARETPKQREARESREKNPPIKRTKVFLWTREENGEYRRESFFQAENGMHLDVYGENQKIYDAFSNEWDCCEEFGTLAPSEFSDGDDSDDEFQMPLTSDAVEDQAMGPDTPLADPSVAAGAQTAPVVNDRPFSIVPSAEMSFDWEDLETSQLLYEIYGFVGPLPLPAQSSSVSDKDCNLLSTIVGLHRKDFDFFKSPVASFAVTFLQLLSASETPKNSTWDIATGNRISISSSALFRRMHVIERTDNPGQDEKWFVFDFKEAATVPWKVAVPNIIDAFFVCRLDHPRPRGSPLTDFEVARELLNHGIQFSTLLPVKPLPLSIGPVVTLPVRLPGYKFTRDDYYAYEQQRAALLSDPRVARSALLRGGIVWRLAVATLSFDDVLEGPTTAATLQRRGIIVHTSDDSEDLCDDGLSQLELDIICGLYHCHTGQGTGFTSKSWWPTDSNWQKNAQHTRWTEKSDHFFTTRLEKLRAGTGEPLNYERWRQNIRGSSKTRRINEKIITAYKDFVKTNL